MKKLLVIFVFLFSSSVFSEVTKDLIGKKVKVIFPDFDLSCEYSFFKNREVSSSCFDEGISWQTGSINKNEKNVNFWIGKRSQSGKKIPKRFNKNLKFHE